VAGTGGRRLWATAVVVATLDPVLVEPEEGRFISPVSLETRIRSSHRARRRCRSSRSASWVPGPSAFVPVANAVILIPSTSVISCGMAGTRLAALACHFG